MRLFSPRSIMTILLIIISFFVAGCWNRRELNTLGIVGMMAVDRKDNMYNISCEVIVPAEPGDKGSKKPSSQFKLVEGTGMSYFDTMRNITLVYDRKLFLPHVRVYVFCEQVGRDGLADSLSFIFRDAEPRLSSRVLIARNIKAKNVLGVTGGQEDVPSRYIQNILKNRSANAKTVDITVLDFLKMYYADGINPVASVVTIKPKVKTLASKEQSEYELDVEGAAVFKRDKLVGYLDGFETRAYNFIRNKVNSGVIVAPVGDSPSDFASIEILAVNTKNEVSIEKEKVKFTVKISINSMIGEVHNKIDLKKIDNINLIERSAEKVIEEEVRRALDKLQQDYRSDILGFGMLLHRKYPKLWKEIGDENWDEVFASAEINVIAEVKITRTGKVQSPVIKEEGAK